MKRIIVLLSLLLCLINPIVKADQPPQVIWESRGGRSITMTVTVDNDNLYVWMPVGSSCVMIAMQDETGMTYIYDATASPDQPGTVSLSELPAGTYDVCLTADNGMTTHGVLTVSGN